MHDTSFQVNVTSWKTEFSWLSWKQERNKVQGSVSTVAFGKKIAGLGLQSSWWSVCLACMKPWIPSQKPGMAVHTCNPCTWEVESEGSEIQGHPRLYCQFEVSWEHMTSCIKNQNKTSNNSKSQHVPVKYAKEHFQSIVSRVDGVEMGMSCTSLFWVTYADCPFCLPGWIIS